MINKKTSGALFRNNYKDKDTHPDYKGKGEYSDGEPFEIAGWVKKDKNGNDYISFLISEPYNVNSSEKKEVVPQGKAVYEQSQTIDDDLPF